jgi:predicted KAP-like P-loop ATPase
MRKNDIKHILKALFDEPLSSKNLLVDREKEIDSLNMVCSFQPAGVYGVCGETGVGKTTVLNFVNPDEGERIYLKLTEKESKEIIIADMLYKLAVEVKKSKATELLKIAKQVIDFVVEERSETSSLGAAGGVFVTGNFSKSTTRTKKFNIYQAYELFDELLEALLKKYNKVVLLIDELDKEKKEEVLVILDSLKTVFGKDGLVVIFSLPFAIYREYVRDRLRWNESGNLENILKDTFFIEPLDDKQIQQMISKRLTSYPDYFDGDALYEIARYSDGNPRDALWISQQIVQNNLDNERITGQIAKETIKKIVKRYFESSWELTDLQKKVLRIVADHQGSRNAIVKELEKRNVKRQTAYTYINRLKENGLIIERDEKLRVSGKIFYMISS